MATSVTQGLSDDQTGGASYRIARRVTLADSMVVRAKLGPAGEGRILDISETGMASQSQIPIQPGGKITVDFDIPDGGHIRTEAQVVWRTVDKRMGLRFLRMSEPARLRLRAWIDTLAGPEPVPAAVPAEAPTKAESAPRDNNEFWHLISEIKASKLYLDSALALIVERAAELTGSTGAALAIGPPENMVCRATLGDAPEVGTVINPDSKLTSECIRTRNTVHVVDTDTDPRVDPFVCRDLNMRSAVLAPAFPNKGDKNFTVVLEMFSSRAKNFSAESIRKLEQLVEVAGVLALGDAADGSALQAEALAAATRASADANESALFAQDELDHLVDRFISDLKIGGPAKPDLKAETKAPAFESKPLDQKRSAAFETSNGSRKTDSFSTKPPSEKPPTTKPLESKPLPVTESVVTSKKPEPSKKTTDKSSEMEVVSLAEPVGAPFVPKRAVERADLTWGQTPEPPASKVPMIAVAALAVISVIGGVIYFVHRSSAPPKPVVEAQVAPAPVTPAADPNTSMTVTATPLPATKPSGASNSAVSEPAKKTSAPESKPAEKETKQSEAPKQAPEPEPIVLAAAKRTTTEAPAPMAAPSITMPTGGVAPPTDIPVSTSAPQLAAQRSTGVTQGVLIHRVSPKYPSAARSYALSGEVVLKGRITKEGDVDQLKAVSGNPLLSGAAIDAVRQWKYQPYKVDGKPIDMETTFRIKFDIPR